MSPSIKPRGDGSAFVAILLLTCLLLTAGLTWQAYDAALSHRTMAESVLRDYADLAAHEFLRRSSNEVGYYGYLELLGALEPWLRTVGDGAPPSPAELHESANPRLRRATELAAYTFHADLMEERLLLAGAAPGPQIEPWLWHELRSAWHSDEEETRQGILHAWIGDVRHTVSYALIDTSGSAAAVGFGVDLAVVPTWMATALSRAPLLPASLGDGELTNDKILVTVVDERQQVRFRAGPPEILELRSGGGARLSVELPYGDRYDGIFAGMTLHMALDPRIAPRLVIGGLPQSRLPVLLTLLGLTAALLLAALLQLRRARALTRLRSDFISHVSHELRTPLTQIRMFAETLLLKRVRSPAEGQRALEIIDQEARRLGHLVENILQFSRHERDATELTLEEHDLEPLVQEVIRTFRPLSGGARIHFLGHRGEGPRAAVDPDALHQIVLNLLDNAVKYGPSDQQIVLGINSSPAWIRVWIDDQGPGIPQRHRTLIWRSFQRLPRDRRSAVAGTGIGLAVVHDLVTLHGGRTWVETGARGGARFVVELPTAGPSPSPSLAEAGKLGEHGA